jgi:hypothetical protein
VDRITLIENAFELARIERLLDRLDPTPAHTCEVPNCVHVRGEKSLPQAA